jgi:N-acyl-D-amino-acid deacylase
MCSEVEMRSERGEIAIWRKALFGVVLAGVSISGTGGQAQATPGSYDIIIRHGHVLDGAANPWFEADIGIRADRIVTIGNLSAAVATKTIDAAGMVVAPGFIDMLGQSEVALLIDNRSVSKISQGITTEITGEGWSIAPQNAQTLAPRKPEFEHYHLNADWTTLDGYFQRLEKQGTPLNIGTYVGATQVREAVIGEVDRAPTPQELEQMKSLVGQAMCDGAFGLSTALIYPPGHYAKTEELIELAKVAGRYGGLYASHMRSEGRTEDAAVDEALRIGREAGVPVEIFHLKIIGQPRWGTMPKLVGKIQAARDMGVDVAASMYPYLAGGTSLAAALPPWVADGGTAKMLERLADPAVRARIRAELASEHEDWENLYLGSGGAAGIMTEVGENSPALKEYSGKRLSDFAADQHKDGVDALMDFVVATKSRAGALFFIGSEADLQYGLKQPWTSIGLDAGEESLDGPLFSPHGHPRAYGSMPRFLGHYVRDLKLMPLPEAIRKITSFPAEREHLRDRGLLKEGFFADITVFDPATINDAATYEQPAQLSRGVKYVVVNGQLEYDNGRVTGITAGHPLRSRGEAMCKADQPR